MNLRVFRGFAGLGRAIALALLALLILGIGTGTAPTRVMADDRPGDAYLQELLAQIEAAQSVAKEKTVQAALAQARDATVIALKSKDHSKEAIQQVQTARKLLQGAQDGPRGSEPEFVGHVSKAIGFADAYLVPVAGPKKPNKFPTPPPKPKPKPDPPDRQTPGDPDPPPPPPETSGRFRVWLTGFSVHNPTYEGVLGGVDPNGRGDEVALNTSVVMVDPAGDVRSHMWGQVTMVPMESALRTARRRGA